MGIKINKMLIGAFENKIQPVVFGPYKKNITDFKEGIYVFVVPKNLNNFNFVNENFFITNVFN